MKKVLIKMAALFLIPLLCTASLAGCHNKDANHESTNPATDPIDESESINWTFATENKIYASPIVQDGVLYVGSDDGHFYALNSEEGTLAWKFKTGYPIRSTAAITGNVLCFQSGNHLYGLDKATGTLVWEHSPDSQQGKTPITMDEWDYHHCSPLVQDHVVYYGNDFGFFYGVDTESGRQVFQYETGQKSPIRSTPAIRNNIIYFGDFAGQLYAVDLATQTKIWSKRTYENKEYPQFGGISSEIKADENYLYFGARNYNFQVLDKLSGDLAWKFTNSSGGWISGTPQLHHDKVYIGGSDTHSLYIFDTKTGKALEEYGFKNGGAMFSKPVFFDQYIMAQTGDAYQEKGLGYLYILHQHNGTPAAELQIKGNIFSTPFHQGNTIYLTSADHSIYSINLENLLKKH